MVFLAVNNVVSFTKTCFYRKRGTVTKRNYVETFHTKMWGPQPHVLIFFLISSSFSVSYTVANLVVWMSQKSYNIIWFYDIIISTLRGKFTSNYCRIIAKDYCRKWSYVRIKQAFRVSRETFNFLLSKIEDNVTKTETVETPLSARKRLIVSLQTGEGRLLPHNPKNDWCWRINRCMRQHAIEKYFLKWK